MNPKQNRWSMPLGGLRELTRSGPPREISAGVTLAALMIPLNIGYAQVAGLPQHRAADEFLAGPVQPD